MIETRPESRPSPSVAIPRLGFAGTGRVGRNRMHAIAAAGSATVAAIADPAENTRELLADFPAAAWTRDFHELLELDLDGVVIATPSALHAAQAISALQSGFAVFCQKPRQSVLNKSVGTSCHCESVGTSCHCERSRRWAGPRSNPAGSPRRASRTSQRQAGRMAATV